MDAPANTSDAETAETRRERRTARGRSVDHRRRGRGRGGAFLGAVGVDGAPAEPQAEGAGEGRLDRAGVGAGVGGGVAAPGPPRVRRGTHRPGGARHRHAGPRRRAGRDGHDVVERARRPTRSGSSRAERWPTMASRVFTARCPAAPARPADRAPDQRATTASAVFSATDSSAARARPSAVERGGVAAAQVRQAARAAADVAGPQRRRHRRALAGQRRPAEDGPGGHGRSRPALRPTGRRASDLGQRAARHHRTDQHAGVGDARPGGRPRPTLEPRRRPRRTPPPGGRGGGRRARRRRARRARGPRPVTRARTGGSAPQVGLTSQ